MAADAGCFRSLVWRDHHPVKNWEDKLDMGWDAARDYMQSIWNAAHLTHLDEQNGKIGEAEMLEMHISTFSLSETFDLSINAGTPVSNKYSVTNHFPYTGELNKVTYKLTE